MAANLKSRPEAAPTTSHQFTQMQRRPTHHHAATTSTLPQQPTQTTHNSNVVHGPTLQSQISPPPITAAPHQTPGVAASLQSCARSLRATDIHHYVDAAIAGAA